MTIKVEVGQEVAVVSYSNSFGVRTYEFDYKVKHITPSGQIVIESLPKVDHIRPNRRFDAAGREMSNSLHNKGELVVNVAEARAYVARQSALRDARAAVVVVRVDDQLGFASKASLQNYIKDLKARLINAETLVERIPD